MLLLLCERSSRFVHDENAGTGAERTGDLDELLLGHREAAGLGLGRDVSADAMEQLGGAGAAILPADTAQGSGRFEPQRDVLGDGEVGEQRGLLINASDAQLVGRGGREVVSGLPGEFDRAAIRLMRASDDLDEGGFAGAILAHQSVHLARPQVE